MFGAGFCSTRGRRGRERRGGGRGKGRESNEVAVGNGIANVKISNDIPEDLIEPCKVFVGNLRANVGNRDLSKALSHYANVTKVIIIKDDIRRSKGYGFVKVQTPEDVQTLLNLKDGNLYIHGQKMVIRPARKKTPPVPGDNDHVRRPLPDRDFDLSHPDPGEPSIHILVDDVLFKILEYLPIKDLVRSERVCRRWQMLVHGMFTKETKLEIAPGNLGLFGPITSNIISKLLILTGPTLKCLKLESIDYSTKRNILKVVGQLCPQLQCLDINRSHGVNFHNIGELTARCKNLKAFIAKRCPRFGDRAMHQLLTSYQNLERLDVSGCPVTEWCLTMLPRTLKELNISHCPDIIPEYPLRIGDRCPNLETLEMDNIRISKVSLENIAKGCTNLTKLSMTIEDVIVIEALFTLKKLQSLTVDLVQVDLQKIIDNMPDLQHLDINVCIRRNGDADFSLLKNLKTINLMCVTVTSASIKSLSRCPKLEEVDFRNCENVTKEVLLDILRGCPNLKKMRCPTVDMDLDFIASVNKIMENRSGKIYIKVKAKLLSPKELLEAQYDNKKIEFDLVSGFSLCEFEDDIDDESLNSDDTMDDFWNYRDMDCSIPDDLLYGDQLHFLHNALHWYDVDDSDLESNFSF